MLNFKGMVGDVLAFEAASRSRHYPGLRTQLHVFKGFDHLNVYPDMITDALKWLTADNLNIMPNGRNGSGPALRDSS